MVQKVTIFVKSVASAWPMKNKYSLVVQQLTLFVGVSRVIIGKTWPVVPVRPVEIDAYAVTVHRTATQSVETVLMDGPFTPSTFVLSALNAAPTL